MHDPGSSSSSCCPSLDCYLKHECLTLRTGDWTEMKEIKRSVPNLDETIHSLLGLKARLTPSWVDSVCQIVQTLHSRGSQAGLETAKSDGEETANDTVISKLNRM